MKKLITVARSTWHNAAGAVPSQPTLLGLALLMLLIGAGQGRGAQAQTPERLNLAIRGPFVGEPVTPTLSLPLRDLPLAQPPYVVGQAPLRRNPRPDLTGFPDPNAITIDPIRQTAPGTGRTPSPDFTVEGLGNLFGGSPPDTIGAVGASQYVQMVNGTYINVYDKSGVLISGPFEANNLWPSGGCTSSNAGDPVVVYDTLADRWVVAQFRSGFANGLCVAVSQTSDALGTYSGYEFVFPDFPDYFKIGVWPDAYYVGSNESTYAAYALDRASMLSGLSATFVRFTGETNFLMPASLDGPTPPPTGAPGYFYTFKDNAFHGGADRLEIFEFNVDWVTPANSTFGLANTLNTASYTYTVCEFFVFDCIPQAGTAQEVDAVSEWPMWRLQYRNFGDHETMVGNFTVDVTGSDLAGIRWFELRKTTGAWTIYQESTFSPDAAHRFMGSIAMDGDGNLALGYSVSSSSLNPGMRYATRLATDPLNTLQSEVTLFAGGGSQTGSNRWGDYSAMSVDPVDDCTFWYTNEYYPTSSATGWHTRIGSFKIPECGTTPPSPTPTMTNTRTATPSSSPTPSVTTTGSATPSLTPSPTATATRTATPSPSPTPSVTTTGSATPSLTPSPTATSIVPELHKVYLPLLGMAAPLSPGCTIYSSSDVPKSIPDNLLAGVTSTLVIPAPGIQIVDLTLRIDDLRHPYDGDLQMTLIAPNGAVEALLVDRVGGSGNDFVGTRLNDALSLPFIADGAAPFTGAFRPDNPLSTFRDLPSAGTWTLKIADRAPRDQGALNAWSLQVCDQLPASAVSYEERDR